MSDYAATLDYLFSQLPMFQRIGPAAFKKDLTNTLDLCAVLDKPQHKFKSIHIAGTNGKGSVTHLVAAALQQAGYKVGVYTSPHYRDFRERIKINGTYISEQAVIDFVAANRSHFERIQPSFFEMTVAMAFDHFAREAVDFAVVEVGMGGRLDSTNIITPLVSCITNISFDHMQFLGDTLPLIAGEKAGIIKPQIPVVIGEYQAETAPVFEAKASEHNAPLYYAQDYYELDLLDSQIKGNTYALQALQPSSIWPSSTPFFVGLYGNYQVHNIKTALMVLDVLARAGHIGPLEAAPTLAYPSDVKKAYKAFNFNHIEESFADVKHIAKFFGRWEILSEDMDILAESAHNEAGIAAMVEQLKSMTYKQLHIVYGQVSDKDPAKVLPKLPADALYYFCKPDIPRGMDANTLQASALALGRVGLAYPSVQEALIAAKGKRQVGDLILVTGSIFVVAEVV